MIRPMIKSDYNEILLPWFDAYEWAPIPKESLPKNCFFLYDEISGTPAVFSSYYTSDSNMVILGYTIANPSLKVLDNQIEDILKFTINHIKLSGYEYIHYSTGRGGIGIVKKLKKLGMTVTCDKGYIMGMSSLNKNIDFLKED